MFRSLSFTLMALLVVAGSVPVLASCIVPVSQYRSVGGSAYVEDYYNGYSDSDYNGDSAPDFGPFDSSQSATADAVGTGYASAGGWQVSAIGASRITARGSQYSNAEGYDWDTGANASGGSVFDVTFDLTTGRDVRIAGSLASYDNGYGFIALYGPSGDTIAEYGYGSGEETFDDTYSLAAGTYRLEARADGDSYAYGYEYSYSFAEYDVTLTACPFQASLTCVPGAGTLPLASTFTVSLDNFETTRPVSRIAARVHVALANGATFPNWRVGFTQVAIGESFSTSWNQNLPHLPALEGSNTFTVEAMDVTPQPYNQPPYGPSGFMTSGSCTVTASAP